MMKIYEMVEKFENCLDGDWVDLGKVSITCNNGCWTVIIGWVFKEKYQKLCDYCGIQNTVILDLEFQKIRSLNFVVESVIEHAKKLFDQTMESIKNREVDLVLNRDGLDVALDQLRMLRKNEIVHGLQSSEGSPNPYFGKIQCTGGKIPS